jgi:CheY-like chemotaxis protein
LKNALEAMEGGDEQQIIIEVAPVPDEGSVAVRVTDTGPGIPDEDMEGIWAAFYTTKGAKHAGLGLSACYQILSQADGRVSAANAPEGGAVFEMLIPVFERRLPEEEFAVGQSVLIIDDDDAWSRFVKDALVQAGTSVTVSVDGQVDFDLFDLILVDNVLEGSDVREVLARVKASGAGDRTLVVASSLRVEQAMELMPFGVRDVVLKPYASAALAELVQGVA